MTYSILRHKDINIIPQFQVIPRHKDIIREDIKDNIISKNSVIWLFLLKIR